MISSPIVIEDLDHHFGEGKLRRQILFGISTEIQSGEIVLLTGPSGSGKTTLLTLIGALRSAQHGSLRVLGRELMGAREQTLTEVRTRIGYIFQAHNLLEALTAQQNVQMSLQIRAGLSPRQHREIAARTLESVGLGDKLHCHPSALSGGERQRVAIARALAGGPEIILADEPTASLDKHTGREIVELLRKLAREQSVTVVLVTHDNRILDIADRILALEDGRLSSLMNHVSTDTHHMLQLLLQDLQKGRLLDRVTSLESGQFTELLEQVTHETQDMLAIVNVIQGETFAHMIRQIVTAFTGKVAELMQAERAALYFTDPNTSEIWTWTLDEQRRVLENRHPAGSGIIGRILQGSNTLRLEEASQDPAYHPDVDGGSSRTLLAMPIRDSSGNTFAAVALANKQQGEFTADDEQQLSQFTESLGLILESWWRMGCDCRQGMIGKQTLCCGPTQPHAQE